MYIKNILWAAVACSSLFLLGGCTESHVSHPESKMATKVSPVRSDSGLIMLDSKVGTGAEAKLGQSVAVHYTGWLYDEGAKEQKGVQFDSSRTRGKPFVFPLGAGRVIKGWDQGVAGMKVGGKRTLIIPADLAYGNRGAGRIPPGATLLFDVELMDIQ